MKVKTLFRWRPGESDVLSSLILRMKDESSWEVWAEEFQFIFPSESRESALLFTSESSSKKRHAQNWASALHEKFKFEVKAPLKLKKQKKKQRQLSLAERSLREFEAPVDFSIEDAKNGGKRVIFIDDVITTGQTALAAYKALGFPEKFEVWSLVYREL